MNLNLLKDNFKAAIDHSRNLNHESIHWNNFFTIYISIKAVR